MSVPHNIMTFYSINEESIDEMWHEHLSYAELGSGDDKIAITDAMFWEFVEDVFYRETGYLLKEKK